MDWLLGMVISKEEGKQKSIDIVEGVIDNIARKNPTTNSLVLYA